MANRPMNVVVITSDELRADALGCMGNGDCRTPRLDSLARGGVIFTNHFTAHGKCVPSRIAMQTGRYSHTDGYRTIHLHMPVDQPHLLGTLKSMGYESAVFGHNHVWDNAAFWGDDNRLGTSYPDYHSYSRDSFASLLERCWPVEQPGPTSLPVAGLSAHGFDYRGRKTEPLTGFCDDNRVEQAIHYLRDVRDRTRPFYLHLNIAAPHPAYGVEEPYFSMYDRDAIVAYPHDLPQSAPLHMRAMRRFRTGEDATERAFREVQAVYYGMVTKVDLLVGRVLDEIERQGLYDSSIVLFTSDHGDFAGQYGLVEKWDTALCDCIMRTPLILRAPGLGEGRQVSSLSEHVDLAPTVLELLGTRPEWGVHGQSLLPVLRNGCRKEAVFADGGHERAMWERFSGSDGVAQTDGKQRTYREQPAAMARAKMVRTEQWKLVVRLEGGNELYDLRADPGELVNLYEQSRGDANLRAVVTDLQERLIEWCIRTDTDRPFEPQVGA